MNSSISTPPRTSQALPHFTDPDAPSLSSEQRLEYLRHYARLLAGFYPGLADSRPVGEEEYLSLRERIKEKPLPSVRRIIPLKHWRWRLGEEGEDFSANDLDDSSWNELSTPFLSTKGKDLWVRARVAVPAFERAALDVEGILENCEIWSNGTLVGRHQGYEPFLLDLSSSLRPGEENVFAIRVEAQERYQIGLAGEVSLHFTARLFISDVFLWTEKVGKDADVVAHLSVTNTAEVPFQGSLNLSLSPWYPQEAVVGAEPVSALGKLDLAAAESQTVTLRCVVPEPRLWTPDCPRLYLARATLFDSAGEAIDDWVETLGIRTIRQKDGKIFLNNREFFLKGFLEMFCFPPITDTYSAICPSDEGIIKMIALCKAAGGNTIRPQPCAGPKSGYSANGWPFPAYGEAAGQTNYRRILFIADQLGMCFLWGTRFRMDGPSGFSKYYREQALERLLVPSVKRVRNHPSIIAWEGGNEIGIILARGAIHWARQAKIWGSGKTEVSRRHVQAYQDYCVEYVRLMNSLDPSRLVLADSPWGEHWHVKGEQVPIEKEALYVENTYWDIHSFTGWYEPIKDRMVFAEKNYLSGKKRPVVYGEYGLEAMPNWSLYAGQPWVGVWFNNGHTPCAEYEKKVIGRALKVLDDSEYLLSQAYQAFCVQLHANLMRTGGDGFLICCLADGLAEGFFHKGTCDLERRAKLGFLATKMAFQPLLATGWQGDVVFSPSDVLNLVVIDDECRKGKGHLSVRIKDSQGNLVEEKEFEFGFPGERVFPIARHRPSFPRPGLYQFEYEVCAG